MQHQKHQSEKSKRDFLANLRLVHHEPRANQLLVVEQFPRHSALRLQAPTGTGKTALGYSFLKTHCGKQGDGFYVTPSKALVDQVATLYPEMVPMYGRNEYPCLYYNSEHQADEIPCSLLRDCPHRVDLETGETFEPGAKPCPYLLAKYKSRQATLTVCTMNYYFFEALARKGDLPHALVIDEVHEWPNAIRRMLSYQITDHHLEQFWELLSSLECREEARLMRTFQITMIDIIKQYASGKKTPLITDDDLKTLARILLRLNRSNIDEKIKKAIADGKINKKEDRELLKQLDSFTGDLYRYISSLEFAMETKERKPLTYVFGYWDRKLEEGKKVQYSLTIQSYAIAGLTRKKMLPKNRLVMSATIGQDGTILEHESGIDGEFIDLNSDFPITNSRIFMPNDVPDLSTKGMSRNDKNRTLRKMLQASLKGSKNGIRSLIIVISEEERNKCVTFAAEEGVRAVSYGDTMKPREAVARFRNGEGDVLIGTEAQFGQGIDLPDGMCEWIFYLRPGYPTKDSPQAQFEERIYGSQRWALWTWRVILKMLQTRGRNIRSVDDRGCIFLMSQQFKRFTYGGLPKWLQPAYVSDISLDVAVKEGTKLLKN